MEWNVRKERGTRCDENGAVAGSAGEGDAEGRSVEEAGTATDAFPSDCSVRFAAPHRALGCPEPFALD